MITNKRLAVYKDKKLDLAVPVTETSITIGRDDGNSVQLPDPKVSKRHAIIHAKADAWVIEDLDSTNGTTVNGTVIKTTELKNGDRIRIGPFELVFESSVTGEWVPSFMMDLSSKIASPTIQHRPMVPPTEPGGNSR